MPFQKNHDSLESKALAIECLLFLFLCDLCISQRLIPFPMKNSRPFQIERDCR